MLKISVDGLIFEFPEQWQASKYDEWSFYRNQFSQMWSGIKSLDLLAIDPQKTGWLIEVKDYRIHQRAKPLDLAEEVARKVFDTLAALPPTGVNSNDSTERAMAKTILSAKQYRVVLHLEQPVKHSKLRPRAIDPAHIKQKLRKLLKPIDAHPLVVEMTNMSSLAWSVN